MENLSKTPVEIVQELIAVHTTRKEAVEKLAAKTPGGDLSVSAQQSDGFIAELMNELSNYGDSVKDGVDRENEYHLRWKETLSNIDSISPEEYGRTFMTLEESLKNIYKNIIETHVDLPASLQEILTRQVKEL